MGTKSTPFDWSTFNPGTSRSAATTASGGLPEGYTAVQVATPATATPTVAGRGVATTAPSYNIAPSYSTSVRGQTTVNNQTAVGGAGGGGGTAWAIQGPDGKVYNRGDPLSYDTTYDTGQKSGGFDDAFYNRYKQSVLDYYMPQVDKQYKDAKDQATYGLARSGNIRSSAANTLTADLSRQNDVNQAGVRNQADTAAGDLRSQVNTEEQKAVSQLYATEDPEVAAQQSLASVRDISLQQPQMSPLSALFNVASIGGANVLKGYQSQQNLNTFNSSLPSATSRSKIVGSG